MEIAETVLLRFTLELEGLRDQGCLNAHLHEVLHGIQWIMFHGLQDFASSPPQRVGSNTNPGDHGSSKPPNT